MKTVCDFEFSDTFSFEFDTPEDQFLCSTSQDIYLPIKSTGDNSSWSGKMSILTALTSIFPLKIF
jgi:hypothetical protein